MATVNNGWDVRLSIFSIFHLVCCPRSLEELLSHRPLRKLADNLITSVHYAYFLDKVKPSYTPEGVIGL